VAIAVDDSRHKVKHVWTLNKLRLQTASMQEMYNNLTGYQSHRVPVDDDPFYDIPTWFQYIGTFFFFFSIAKSN